MKHHINDMKRRALHNADAAYYVLSGTPDKTYSLGVISTVRSFHSSVGISARRRSISASPVETIWMTAAWPAARSAVTDRISVGVFMLVRRWPKKRCFVDSKAERAADLACRFRVPSEPVMLAASIAASRLLWMTAKAPA